MHPHRRRKKRPNYGVRTVDVSRGQNGFGFTISGQQPCILSCIVADSPADAAGLRAGDFLISVNGLNVSKLPHDAVVQLIGNSVGFIKMAIAENYFSDSSDEDLLNGRSAYNLYRQRPKYPHSNKSRMQRTGRISNFNQNAIKTANNIIIDHDNINREYKPSLSISTNAPKIDIAISKPVLSSSSSHSVILNTSISNTNDINNVSAMVNPGIEQVRAIKVVRDLKTGAMFEEAVGPQIEIDKNGHSQNIPAVQTETDDQDDNQKSIITIEKKMEPICKIMEKQSSLECRAIVGYLGTIEMPKQIATSSKLQTVRSCIRKMRQEKRSPCTVLMTILPTCMTLRNSSGELLAEYPAKRINFVSCSSENDYRFFGLVTSTSYPIEFNDYDGMRKQNCTENSENTGNEYDIAISNSCHVFMIDTQIIEHQNHVKKAETFKIKCTVDPVTGVCLEFPNNSEYIVNIIRIIYSLKSPNGFSGKCNIENISRLSNIDKHSRSPRGSNFVRKINRPKLNNRSNNVNPNIHIERNDAYQNENPANMPREILNRQESDAGQPIANGVVANSPQPSNHSEITTASSNSDSGIGFHNDCQNISDRILVVDFPNPVHNNFNINAPYVGPVFNSREGKILPLRENNRPAGVVGLDADMDRQFLSNTTPVVEGFGGQGRPLNHMEPIMLENIPSQISSQSIYLAKNSVGESSGINGGKCPDNGSTKGICPSNIQYLYSVAAGPQKHTKNKLTVRAMPDHYNPTALMRKGEACKSPNKCNAQQIERHNDLLDEASCIDESPHYDPVYSDGPACYEEHHYEIIYPDENNMHNENVANAKKCYRRNDKYDWIEASHVNNNHETYYSERPVDVPCRLEYFENERENKNMSTANCSYDNMSVTSSKSHDLNEKKCKNFSIDDISIYSSKSHDEMITSSSKFRAKARKLQTSVDDILIFGLKKSKTKDSPHVDPKKDKDSNLFLHPANVVKLKGKKIKKPSIFPSKTKTSDSGSDGKRFTKKCSSKSECKDAVLDYKLSPKVFNGSRPSASVEDICKSSRYERTKNNWGHLEGTASEPDLRDCHHNEYFLSESGSPFGRWAGSGSGRALTHRSYRRPGSLVSSEHDMYTKCEADEKVAGNEKQQQGHGGGGVGSWAHSLERLLSEPAGVHALAAFLEREFSAENIRFWTACERWTRAPAATRPSLAAALHSRFLADGAPDPVNVDASARHLAADRLALAPSDLFLQAQKQIFNLMKFDSYPRFLKSDIYKECLVAELQGRPAPYPGDPSLAVSPNELSPTSSPNKLKKSLSNAEDRRHKSLIPWHRRLRSKSRDRYCEDEEDNRTMRSEDSHDPKGSNSSLLTGWDVTKGLNPKNCSSSSNCSGSGCGCGGFNRLCRVIVPGLAATSVVVAAGGDETVRQLLDKLLEKRAVRFLAYEVYSQENNKAIDINLSSSVLAGREVTVEQRVVFKLDLPNRKIISVKSKPNKALGDVLRPILHKYGVGSSEGLCVTLGNTVLELTQLVQVADGQRLQVALRSTPIQSDPNVMQNGKGTFINPNDNNQIVNGAVPSLDEITNRVFEELLQGKAEKHSVNIEEESIKSDNCSSEHSSAIFGRFLRRDDHRSKGVKIKKQIPHSLANQAIIRSITQSASSEGGSSCCMDDNNCNGPRKPLIAKLRAGVKIQNAVGTQGVMENAEFLENLKQMQRARLKDTVFNNNNPNMINGDHNFQKGKENNGNCKADNQFHFYDEKQISCNTQNYPNNALPVAAVRVIPTVPISKPCPAPRLSLGQVSVDKQNSNSDIKSENVTQRKSVDSDDTESNKKYAMEYSPTVENSPTTDVNLLVAQKKERISTNSDTQNNNQFNHGNLAQDYLNSSTTSGSDHFTRNCDILNSSFHSSSSSCDNESYKRVSDPPPLPPKPKVLPMKPSNWGNPIVGTDESLMNLKMQEVNLPEVKALNEMKKRTAYLDQPSSSFV